MSALLLAFMLNGAPPATAQRVDYGGDLTVWAYDSAWELDPNKSHTSASRVAQQAVFEPLFRLDEESNLVPVLATSAPLVNGRQATIFVRPHVYRHDGARLTPQDVAESIQRFGAPGAVGAYVVSGIARGSDGRLKIETTDNALRFELVVPDWDIGRRFASPHAVIAVKAPAGIFGTGPFLLKSTSDSTVVLSPFKFHRDGRPYLDQLQFRLIRSRAGAVLAAARKTQLILRIPSSSRVPADTRRPMGSELVVLVASKSAAKHLSAIDGRIDRQRLLRALGAADARPVGKPARVKSTGVHRLSLASSPGGPAGGAVRHIQLALAPAGFRLTAATQEPGAIRAELDSNTLDLWLATVRIAGGLTDATETMLALDALSSAIGRGPVFSAQESKELATARTEDLVALAQSRRRFVVLAELPVTHNVLSKYVGIHLDARIGPRFDDAHP